jgi:actin-like ATPase involved in cell morphogenesis
MADTATPALGLSIGSTNLAAVTANLAIIRKPVLTLYRQRAPEVGVPSENPRLDEPGLVITDFVDRLGDPVGIVAADGSTHRSEPLIADAMRSLAYAATGGRPLPENIAVTYPAHWSAKSVDALGAALGRVPEWSNRAKPLVLIPDPAATLFAVRANPGIPARGTVAVCDFGGSGTSITLMDAAGDYQALAPTVRHHEFSGDMIDQALLTAVMADMPNTGAFDPSGTSAIGSLSRLRSGCRGAKEQLSSNTVATLADGDIRLTRNELDEAIRGPLTNFVAVLDEALRRNGIRDLVAVVSVGGGANIPAVTTTLSGHFRVPVVTTPRPQLAAAIGGALRAAQGPGDTNPTALTPAAPATATAAALAPAARAWPGRGVAPAGGTATAEAPAPVMMPAVAWSEAADSRVPPDGAGGTSARPALKFEEADQAPPAQPKNSVIPWRRLPVVVIIGAVVAMLLVGTALAIGLGSRDKPATTPGGNTTPASPAPPATGGSSPPVPATQSPPPPSGVDTNPPPATNAPSPAPPATQEGTEAPAPPAAAPPEPAAPPPEPAAPPAPAAPPPAPAVPPVPPIPRIPAIPPIPRIPGFNAPIPGLPEIPTLVSQLAPRGH